MNKIFKQTKNLIRVQFFGLGVMTLLFQACFPDDTDPLPVEQVLNYDPIKIPRAELENSIALKDPIPIRKSGKIYVKDNFLFINEVRKGFHIYDNTNPEDPKPVKFLQILGATDLAIRENVFYSNQATDLITLEFDVKTETVNVTKRLPNTFPEILSPDGFQPFSTVDEVVIDWVRIQ